MKKNKAQYALSVGAVLGIMMWNFFVSAFQDILGKEGYIQLAKDNWINTSPYMWIIFLILTKVIYDIIHKKLGD